MRENRTYSSEGGEDESFSHMHQLNPIQAHPIGVLAKY